jgi:hypothetical protein
MLKNICRLTTSATTCSWAVVATPSVALCTCSHANVNTGTIALRGSGVSSFQSQTWTLCGGAGSRANLYLNIR